MVESKTYHSVRQILPAHGGRVSAKKRIPRTMLVAIVTAVFLASPIFVSGSSKGILSASWMVNSISVPHRSEASSLLQVLQIPRGGAMNRKRKGGLYLKALDDEILWLQQQLRRTEQEKRSLNKKLSKRRQTREDAMKSKNTSKQKEEARKTSIQEHEEDILRLANLEQLEKQKESLLAAKSQLESIKLDYDQKLLALELDLSKSKSRNSNLEKTFLAHIKELEASLKKVREAGANPKMNNDPELSRKINEACQVAIAEFWVEGNRKLQEHEQQLKAKYEQEIAEERRLSALAVEKQRQKMRALARATAIREKELFARKKLESRKKPQNSKNASSAQKKEEALEREKIKSLRQEAERKAKEEEKRMWLELERELKEERERLQRMKQREEEEKRRCEQEELERRRLLQQHALDLEERLRKEQQQAASGEMGRSRSSIFGRFFGSRKKLNSIPEPTTVSIENYQRRVMWQPITLPPKDAIQVTGPRSTA